jgi:hypothetical protein
MSDSLEKPKHIFTLLQDRSASWGKAYEDMVRKLKNRSVHAEVNFDTFFRERNIVIL